MSITAKVLADTINPYTDQRITTFVLHYPRTPVHDQFLMHRGISRSVASARAINIDKMIRAVLDDPAYPVDVRMNQKGMQGYTTAGPDEEATTMRVWQDWLKHSVAAAIQLKSIGIHKQTVNRLLQPFSHVDVIATATDWPYFFALRLADDVQPEMRILAQTMFEAISQSTPVESDLHLAFVTDEERATLRNVDGTEVPDDKLLCISAARCARVSYANHLGEHPTQEEDLAFAARLWTSKHRTPFEHSAMSLVENDANRNFIGWQSARSYFEEVDDGNDIL